MDLYVGWGTPKELHDFEEYEYYYNYVGLDKVKGLTEEKQKLWEKYFKKYLKK